MWRDTSMTSIGTDHYDEIRDMRLMGLIDNEELFEDPMKEDEWQTRPYRAHY